MRTRALPRALLLALSAIPAQLTGQSFAQADLSYGLFDGVGVGMTQVMHTAENPAFGSTVGGGYGIYSERAYGKGRSDYRNEYRYDDYCWDEAWDLRWGRGYYGWHSRYDHLDFYHDCRSGGLDYAYDRWRWHARRAYYRPHDYYDYYDHYGYGRGRVVVSVYVTDPFWRPWGPYWSYDPWGWYWDGYNDGFRDGRWGRTGGVIYAGGFGGGRVRGVYAGRPSPLAPTRFKEDPRVLTSDGGGRRAQPRDGVAAAPVAPARTAVRAPTDEARGSARPSVGRGAADAGSPAARPSPAAPSRGGERPTAVGRPTDRVRGAEAPAAGGSRPSLQPERGAVRARPSAPAAVSGGARPSGPSVREGSSRPSAPAASRPSEGARSGSARPAPSAPATRSPSPEQPESRRAAPSVRSAPAQRDEPQRPAARAPAREPSRAPAASQPSRRGESGGSTRSAPATRSSGGESTRSAPAARSSGGSSGGSTRSAPAARSGGGESTRSAPAARRPATR